MGKVKLEDFVSEHYGEHHRMWKGYSYMGSGPLKLGEEEPNFEDEVAEVLKTKHKPIKVSMVTANNAIGAVNPKTKAVVLVASVAEFQTCGTMEKNSKVFYYVTTNERFGFSFVHVFTGKPKTNEELVASLNEVTSTRGSKASFVVPTALENISLDNLVGTFTGRYLGEKALKTKGGDHAVFEAYEEMKKKRKKGVDGLQSVVIISTEAVRWLEAVTEEVLHSIFIKDVSHATVCEEGQAEEIFAVVDTNERLGSIICHFFACRKDDPDDMCRAVGVAKNQMLEEQEAKLGDPFHAPGPVTADLTGPLKDCEMKRAELTAITELGAGQFGTVYMAIQATSDEVGREDEGEPRAVKMLRGAAGEADKEEFIREAETMQLLHHEHVVNLVGVCMTQVPWLVVVEMMQYGDLRKVLQAYRSKKQPITFAEQMTLVRQMCSGMAYIAGQGFVHLDLAARNVLVHSDNLIKIGDFGITRKVDPETGYFRLTKHLRLAVRWMAPEVLGKSPLLFSEKTDVWAGGVVMWEIATYGILPYKQFSSRDAKTKIKEGLKLPVPPGCHKALLELMFSCFQEPEKRPTFTTMEETSLKLLEECKDEKIRDLGKTLNDDLAKRDRQATIRVATQKRKTLSAIPAAGPLASVAEE